MPTPLSSNQQRPISASRQWDRLHAARKFACLKLKYVHPSAHDEIIVRVYSTVGLVLDECH